MLKRSPTSRADYSRRLPRPLDIPTVVRLTTLADVRRLIYHYMPEATRPRATSRRGATCVGSLTRLPAVTLTQPTSPRPCKSLCNWKASNLGQSDGTLLPP
jgi:hypothetical protein